MTMKRKRRTNKEKIDWIELRSEATRFDRERQYLIDLRDRNCIVMTALE